VLATPLERHHWSGFEIVVFVVTVEYRLVLPVLSVVPVVCAALLLLLLKNHMLKHCLYCQCSGLRNNRFVGVVMKTMMKKMEA
jgi:hypothetical protein